MVIIRRKMQIDTDRMRGKQHLRDQNCLTADGELPYWKCKCENDTLELAVFK